MNTIVGDRRTVAGGRRRLGLRIAVVGTLVLSSAITVSATSGVADAPTAAGSVVAVTPARVADSRAGLQIGSAVPASGSVTVKVAGKGGVPSSKVASVLLSVTAVTPQASGYLTVWPSGMTRSATSSLNFNAGTDVANTVITPVGSDGSIQLFNGSAGAVNLVVDVNGYTLAGTATTPGTMVAVTPARLVDSSTSLQVTGGLSPDATTKFQITGRGGVPQLGVAAAVLNVTAASPDTAGYVTAWPSGLPRTPTSSVNFNAGTDTANAVVVPVGTDGAIQLYNGSAGTVGVRVDVTGYIVAGDPNSAGALAPTTPARIADSRTGNQIAGAVGASGSAKVQVAGRGPVPYTGVAAAVLTITAVDPQASGWITVYPNGISRPATSNLNMIAGRNSSNTVVVPVSTSGAVQLYNGSGGAVNLVVDVTGYVMSQAATPYTAWDSGPVRADRDRNDPLFTIAVMPDTQMEVWSPDKRFRNRSQWLADNAGAGGLDLRFVSHTGDVVNWDTDAHDQYAWAAQGLEPLTTAGIPWSLSNGNHDNEATGEGGGARDSKNTRTLVRDTSIFNRYFTAAKYGDVTGGFEQGKVDNIYSRFYAGGKSWLMLNLELWPRVEVVNWAKSVVANHPHDNVIVATHSYLNADGTIYQNSDYGTTSPQYLYDNLISKYANIRMVFSGHTGVAASRTDVGVNGNTIYSFVAAIHSPSTNPVRILYIDTASGTIQSRIVAPFDNASTWTPYNLDIGGVRWVS